MGSVVIPASSAGDRDPHDLNTIAAYAEHRLGADERDRVERHLVACADCRATLATYARGAAAEPETTAQGGGGFGRTPHPAWLALAAGVVLAVGASLYTYTRMNPVAPGAAIEGTRPAPSVVPAAPPVESPVPPPAAPPARPSASRGEDLSRMRSGARRVGEKMFRLEAGTWVDTTFDLRQALPVTDISTPEARTALLEEKPALRSYADLGPQVIVVLDGRVYRFGIR